MVAHGVVIGALPLIVFNSLSLALSGTILFLKIRNDRRDEGHANHRAEGRAAPT